MEIKAYQTAFKEVLFEISKSDDWPFHAGPVLSEEALKRRLESDYFTKKDVKTFIVFDEQKQGIGFFRIFDLVEDYLSQETPLFDIRLMQKSRNKGIGKKAVNWLTDFVFSNYPNKTRIEANTRHDNFPMRKVLEQCGYCKEAHYRQCWPMRDKTKVDGIGYAILRQDWKTKTSTPVNWNDF